MNSRNVRPENGHMLPTTIALTTALVILPAIAMWLPLDVLLTSVGALAVGLGLSMIQRPAPTHTQRGVILGGLAVGIVIIAAIGCALVACGDPLISTDAAKDCRSKGCPATQRCEQGKTAGGRVAYWSCQDLPAPRLSVDPEPAQ